MLVFPSSSRPISSSNQLFQQGGRLGGRSPARLRVRRDQPQPSGGPSLSCPLHGRSLHFREAILSRSQKGIYHCVPARPFREPKLWDGGPKKLVDSFKARVTYSYLLHASMRNQAVRPRSAGTRSTHTTLQRTIRARQAPSIRLPKDPATPRARNAATGLDWLLRPTSPHQEHPQEKLRTAPRSTRHV